MDVEGRQVLVHMCMPSLYSRFVLLLQLPFKEPAVKLLDRVLVAVAIWLVPYVYVYVYV